MYGVAGPGSPALSEKHGVVIDPISVRDNGNFFDEVASNHGGEYDGWLASV
jgi:hypothetical protein